MPRAIARSPPAADLPRRATRKADIPAAAARRP
jgi:hypothetical protein